MNRNLVLFAFFLVILGAGFGTYILSLFGLFMLVPAFLVPSKPSPRRAPVSAEQGPGARVRMGLPVGARRIIPKPQPAAEPPPADVGPEPSTVMAATQSGGEMAYSQALSPAAMFPSLSLYVGSPLQPASVPQAKPSERDELIETGTLLLLLRLFLG